jgi:hypothetical protein
MGGGAVVKKNTKEKTKDQGLSVQYITHSSRQSVLCIRYSGGGFKLPLPTAPVICFPLPQFKPGDRVFGCGGTTYFSSNYGACDADVAFFHATVFRCDI